MDLGDDGNILNEYIRGMNLIKNENDDYFIYNAHGDVTSLTDDLGIVTKTYDYDAFGVEINPDAEDTNFWRYCAEYWDVETETIYLRARRYNPRSGRFTQVDVAMDGLNWYTYCGSDPINFRDPTGYLREGEWRTSYNGEKYWCDDPDSEDYGANSKVYLALLILGEAWEKEALLDYRSDIEHLAKTIRNGANSIGSVSIEMRIDIASSMGMLNSVSTVEQVISSIYMLESLYVGDARDKASAAAYKRFSNDDPNGTGEGNAFLHAHWNAILAINIGEDLAKIFTDAHEFGWYAENLNDITAMKMDLYNNAEGRRLGGIYDKRSGYSLESWIFDNQKSGKLRKKSGTDIIPTNAGYEWRSLQ